MKTETDRQPRAGEIVMICAHSLVKSATSRGAHLIKIQGGPRVFSNLDDRFFSEWLYFCDDCHTKASADACEVAGLIHGPMEWISNCEGVLDRAAEGDSGARDDQRRSGLPAPCHG
jgi:hypothetical protein